MALKAQHHSLSNTDIMKPYSVLLPLSALALSLSLILSASLDTAGAGADARPTATPPPPSVSTETPRNINTQAEKKSPFKQLSSSFRRIPPSTSNPIQNKCKPPVDGSRSYKRAASPPP